MKHVLLVASTYLPPICGGAEWVAWDIAKRLVHRFDVHLLTCDEGSPEIRETVQVHNLPRRRWMPLTYSSIRRSEIQRVLKEISPDLIHSHMILPWGYILRREKSIKIITSHESRKPNRITRYLMRTAIQHANVITSPSRWAGEYLQQQFGHPFIRIPNGVDTKTFKPMPNVERNPNVILYVGRLTKNKGAMDLIESAKRLPEYQFWFRGSADIPTVGSQRVQIPMLPNVKIIEFIPSQRELAVLYNRATICAFPSQYENFPLVGLETMACGRTLVATKGPRNGYPELVTDGRDGVLIEPHDVDALTRSIKDLMENESMREQFEQNASKKASQYDWDKIADKYGSLFESALRR